MGYMNEFPHTRMFDSDLREILELYLNIKELPNTWESYKLLMDNNFKELKDFVTDYFNNLDVQEEINNKIDDLVANGELIELFNKYIPYITPQMYGAIGEGVDETAHLQAMLDNANGVTIIWKKGTYATRPLYIRNNTTIFFESGVTLKPTPNYDTHDCVLNILNVDNVRIYGNNATILMNKVEYTTGEWRHCIYCIGSRNVLIEGLHLKDSGGDGIIIGGEQIEENLRESYNIVVRNCVIDNNRRQGVSIVGLVRDVWIVENMITNTNGTAPQAGIDIEPNAAEFDNEDIHIIRNKLINNENGILCYNNSYNIEIKDNYLVNCGAIQAARMDANSANPTITIDGNNIVNSKSIAMYIKCVDDIIIKNNHIANINTDGIYLENSLALPIYRAQVIGNRIMCPNKTGIAIDNSAKNNIIANNILVNCTTRAIRLSYGPSENEIRGNLIDGCGNDTQGAVLIENSNNNTIADNIFRNIPKVCIEIANANSNGNIIKGNDFRNNDTQSLSLASTNNTVSENIWSDGARSPYRLTTLPTANINWLGVMVFHNNTLKICIYDGASYSWKTIEIN